MEQQNLFNSQQIEQCAAQQQAPEQRTSEQAPEQRACESCKGTGKSEYSSSGKCNGCHGAGTMCAPDVLQIVRAIGGKRGLRSSAPEHTGKAYTTENVRAYYVWRLARFHGGQDVTMPIVATTLLHGDPFQKELDAIAESVARRAFGTDMAAAYRWAGALGHSVTVPENLPATAFANGPVVATGDKPDEELPEMY